MVVPQPIKCHEKIRILRLVVASVALLCFSLAGISPAHAKGTAVKGGDNIIAIWPRLFGDDSVVVPGDIAEDAWAEGERILFLEPTAQRVNPRTVVALEDTHF